MILTELEKIAQNVLKIGGVAGFYGKHQEAVSKWSFRRKWIKTKHIHCEYTVEFRDDKMLVADMKD